MRYFLLDKHKIDYYFCSEITVKQQPFNRLKKSNMTSAMIIQHLSILFLSFLIL